MVDEKKSLFENMENNLLSDGAPMLTVLENVIFTEAGISG